MKKTALPAFPMPRKDKPNVLPLEGEIDLHVSPAVAASLQMMIEKKPKKLIVDLARVTYVDSSGLAVLIEGMQKTSRNMAGSSRSPACRNRCARSSRSHGLIRSFKFSRRSRRR